VLPSIGLSSAPRLAAALVGLVLMLAPDPSAGAAPRKPKKPVRRTTVRRPPAPPLVRRVVMPSPASDFDRRVALAAQNALRGQAGSVVAMDPHTGRLIAVVNPSLGVERAYQPCSVFKVVVAIAGLTEGVITPETHVDCRGGSCWYWPGHGPIDLRRALAGSCNPYFEWVGERLGFARVQKYAHVLGLGERSGVNLERETTGVFPLFVGPAQVGHMSSHAKGIATTAVQLGVLMSATVNGGVVYQPRLAPAAGYVPVERWRLPPGIVMGGLYDGFMGAVNEGSAAEAFDPAVAVGGKTGTCAGVGWFASYAPVDRPEIVIVSFLAPGNGHSASAVGGRMYTELYGARGTLRAERPPASVPSGSATDRR
jgi:penicillin-binding protein 2